MTRAEHRLEIARGFLGVPADTDVMLVIDQMDPDKRDELRGLVDWVEAFDNAALAA